MLLFGLDREGEEEEEGLERAWWDGFWNKGFGDDVTVYDNMDRGLFDNQQKHKSPDKPD